MEKDEQILKQAVQQQLSLGKFSLEKGSISKKWTEAQNSWSILNGHKKKNISDHCPADIQSKPLVSSEYIYPWGKQERE